MRTQKRKGERFNWEARKQYLGNWRDEAAASADSQAWVNQVDQVSTNQWGVKKNNANQWNLSSVHQHEEININGKWDKSLTGVHTDEGWHVGMRRSKGIQAMRPMKPGKSIGGVDMGVQGNFINEASLGNGT